MKKIVVQTVFYNCDDEWIEDYVTYLCINPYLKCRKAELMAGDEVKFESKDPTSNAFGVTTYQIIEQVGVRPIEGGEK